MNQDLALKVLGQIMDWPDDRARKEFDWLKLMARLKYDGYRDFQAGMRFIESLVTWLQQFRYAQERETAYEFVRHSLVYIGPGEMQQIVEQFYPRTVHARIIRMAADQCGIQPYRVLADESAWAAANRLRRQTLFMGLSDGARMDTIRRANSDFLSNEQFAQVTQVDAEKWKDMLENLRNDLCDKEARFRLVYLIDDFTATGTSFLRLDNGTNEWKGKLIRFRDSIDGANSTLPDKPLDDDWELCIHHYIASPIADEAIKNNINLATEKEIFCEGWACGIHLSTGMLLPVELPIDKAGSDRYDNFIKLTKTYYNPAIRTKHTDIGGVTHLGLGYGGCALPLILEHNTPNNTVALLWAETDGDHSTPPMKPLFRRRQRHL